MIIKDGAVRCSHCQSVDVELIEPGPMEARDPEIDGGKAVEEYQCRACKKKFLKPS
jgi:hypothetical protein